MEKTFDFKKAFINLIGLPEKFSSIFFAEVNLAFRKEIFKLVFTGVANGKSVNTIFIEAAKGNSKLYSLYLKIYRNAITNRDALMKETLEGVSKTLNKKQITRLKHRYFYLGDAKKRTTVGQFTFYMDKKIANNNFSCSYFR